MSPAPSPLSALEEIDELEAEIARTDAMVTAERAALRIARRERRAAAPPVGDRHWPAAGLALGALIGGAAWLASESSVFVVVIVLFAGTFAWFVKMSAELPKNEARPKVEGQP